MASHKSRLPKDKEGVELVETMTEGPHYIDGIGLGRYILSITEATLCLQDTELFLRLYQPVSGSQKNC